MVETNVVRAYFVPNPKARTDTVYIYVGTKVQELLQATKSRRTLQDTTGYSNQQFTRYYVKARLVRLYGAFARLMYSKDLVDGGKVKLECDYFKFLILCQHMKRSLKSVIRDIKLIRDTPAQAEAQGGNQNE